MKKVKAICIVIGLALIGIIGLEMLSSVTDPPEKISVVAYILWIVTCLSLGLSITLSIRWFTNFGQSAKRNDTTS